MKKETVKQIRAMLDKYGEALPLAVLETVRAILRSSVPDLGTDVSR